MSGTNPSTDPLAPREPYRWGAKSESLEAKFKMLALLPFNRGAKRKHSLVLAFLLDWYHSKYGNALASVRHILDHLQARDPEGKGLFAGDVHSALADLIAWGFLEQEKGSGRRASRYVPRWDILDSVQGIPNARGGVHSVRETPNESVRETPNATSISVRDSLNEDPSTRTRLEDRGTGVETQYQGQQQFALLQRALGLSGVDDSSEMHGVRIGVIPDGNRYLFRSLGEAA